MILVIIRIIFPFRIGKTTFAEALCGTLPHELCSMRKGSQTGLLVSIYMLCTDTTEHSILPQVYLVSILDIRYPKVDCFRRNAEGQLDILFQIVS